MSERRSIVQEAGQYAVKTLTNVQHRIEKYNKQVEGEAVCHCQKIIILASDLSGHPK